MSIRTTHTKAAAAAVDHNNNNTDHHPIIISNGSNSNHFLQSSQQQQQQQQVMSAHYSQNPHPHAMQHQLVPPPVPILSTVSPKTQHHQHHSPSSSVLPMSSPGVVGAVPTSMATAKMMQHHQQQQQAAAAAAAARAHAAQQQQQQQQQQQAQAVATPTLGQSLTALMAHAAGGSEGLINIPTSVLQQTLEPVKNSLERLDAEALLDLQRVEHGARLYDGVNVQPIHNQIQPQYFSNNSVRYIHINEIPSQYSIGIFVFPPFSKIPLHDHPGMCVLSRLLYGDLQCFSLDFAREEKKQNEEQQDHSSILPKNIPPGSRRALKRKVTHLHAPGVTVLYPYEGNLHEFFAGPQGAAVLDILLPPYDTDAGRDCTFYDIYEEPEIIQQQAQKQQQKLMQQLAGLENNENADDMALEEAKDDNEEKTPCWVFPTNQPEDFHCLSGSYGNLGSAVAMKKD